MSSTTDSSLVDVNFTLTSDDDIALDAIVNYARANATASSAVTNLLAFIVATCALMAVIQSAVLLFSFVTRRRQSLSADYAYCIIYFCTLSLAIVGLSYLGPLFEDSLGAVRMTKISISQSKAQATSPVTTTRNCFLPFVFQVSHMLMFYVISLTALANYLNIAFPRYSMTTRSMAVVCAAISIFCVLVNMHFLLAHCANGSTEELFDVADSSVVVKYVIVDGMALLLTVLLCAHSVSLISATRNAPDAQLWKRECMASVTVGLLFGSNTALTFALNVAAQHSVTLTLHATHITMATTMVTLAAIPFSLCCIRPATRSDFDGFFERIKVRLYAGEDDLPGCCARCLSHSSAEQVDMEPYWVYAETSDTAQLVVTNPNSASDNLQPQSPTK